MTKLLVSGGIVLTPVEERTTDIWSDGDLISGLGTPPGSLEDYCRIDARGCFVTPGLIDLQVNGGPPCDFWSEPSRSDVTAFSKELLSRGVTTILPTVITGDPSAMKRTRDFLKRDCGAGSPLSVDGLVRMPGLHFEGPFLSPERPGVHPPEHVRPLRLDALKDLIDDSVRLVTLAPEGDPGGECIAWLNERGILAALGHSNATYEEACLAFERGVSLMTHTFNALPPLHHRKPGAVGAALLQSSVTCCMICDGLHLDPAAAAIILKCKGVASTILVTDIARIGTSGGGLVGASIYLSEAVRNVAGWGLCSFADAIRMATLNPAAVLGLKDRIGVLSPGCMADMVLWDSSTLEIKQVIFNGRPVEFHQPVAVSN
jgi:N-acetylglucosamine-6-phosphate deacetylase